MPNDFSLLNYESVPVGEYLPILEKIKYDLQYIYDTFQVNYSNSQNSILESIPNTDSNVPTEESSRNTSTNMESIGKTLYPETEKQILEQLQRIVLLIPKKTNEDDDQVTNLLNTVEIYVKSVTDIQDKDGFVISSSKESLNEELTVMKMLHKDCEKIINDLRNTSERYKDQLKSRDENIQGLQKNIQKLKENSNEKDTVIHNLKDDIKNQKQEFDEQNAYIKRLEEDVERLKKEKVSVKSDTESQKCSDMRKFIEDQTKEIFDLNSKIKKLELKNMENQKSIETISELENKIKYLENKEGNDEHFEQLTSMLQCKKNDIRERDVKIIKLESELLEFDTKIGKFERDNRALNRKLSTITAEYKEIEESKEEIDKKYKTLLKEYKALEKKAANAESNTKYVEEIKNLKTSLQKEELASKNKDKVIDDLKQEKERNNLALIKSKELSNNFEKFKIESEEKYNELIKQHEEDMKKKVAAINTMREKLKVKANEPSETSLETKKLLAQMRNKETELKHMEEKYYNMNEAYNKASTDWELSKKEVTHLKSELDNIKKLNLVKGSNENRRDNVNPKRQENNQFPDWWKTHMNK